MTTYLEALMGVGPYYESRHSNDESSECFDNSLHYDITKEIVNCIKDLTIKHEILAKKHEILAKEIEKSKNITKELEIRVQELEMRVKKLEPKNET